MNGPFGHGRRGAFSVTAVLLLLAGCTTSDADAPDPAPFEYTQQQLLDGFTQAHELVLSASDFPDSDHFMVVEVVPEVKTTLRVAIDLAVELRGEDETPNDFDRLCTLVALHGIVGPTSYSTLLTGSYLRQDDQSIDGRIAPRPHSWGFAAGYAAFGETFHLEPGVGQLVGIGLHTLKDETLEQAIGAATIKAASGKIWYRIIDGGRMQCMGAVEETGGGDIQRIDASVTATGPTWSRTAEGASIFAVNLTAAGDFDVSLEANGQAIGAIRSALGASQSVAFTTQEQDAAWTLRFEELDSSFVQIAAAMLIDRLEPETAHRLAPCDHGAPACEARVFDN